MTLYADQIKRKMESFFEELNNREIAVGLWIGIILLILAFFKDVFHSMVGVIRSVFSKKVIVVFLSIALYCAIIVYTLFLTEFWNYLLLKDTIFWIFGVAFVLVFRITKSVSTQLFRDMFFDNLKFTLLFEYVVNLYVFPLWIELILIAVLLTFGAMKPIADREEKHKNIRGCISNTIIIISAGAIIFSIVKTVQNYKEFLTGESIRSLLLGPILTILYIPFFYLLTMYIQYEILFVEIDCTFADKRKVKVIKKSIRKTVGLNLRRLNNVSKKFDKVPIYQGIPITKYIRDISE